LIDGDGCFLVSQKGYTSCEITVALEDEKLLRIIQNKIGGSVKIRSGVKAIRIRFQNKVLMISLTERVNGFIYNSVRIPQFARVCDILNIPIKLPNFDIIPLPWFMGFFDADGTVNFYPHFKNQIHYRNQLTISVSNKYYQNLLPFKIRFGGHIYFDKSGSGKFI
jgi:ubiquinol-cytochrome c reductase cytochrome b subunit